MFPRFLYGIVTVLLTTSAFAQQEVKVLPENRFLLPRVPTYSVTRLTGSQISAARSSGIGVRYKSKKSSGFASKISGFAPAAIPEFHVSFRNLKEDRHGANNMDFFKNPMLQDIWGNKAGTDFLDCDNSVKDNFSLSYSNSFVNTQGSYHVSRMVHVGYFFLRTLQTFSFDRLRR
jgi:hypothetical protein